MIQSPKLLCQNTIICQCKCCPCYCSLCSCSCNCSCHNKQKNKTSKNKNPNSLIPSLPNHLNNIDNKENNIIPWQTDRYSSINLPTKLTNLNPSENDKTAPYNLQYQNINITKITNNNNNYDEKNSESKNIKKNKSAVKFVSLGNYTTKNFNTKKMRKINIASAKEKKTLSNKNENSQNFICKIKNDFKIKNNNIKNNSGKRDTITRNTNDLVSQILNMDHTNLFENLMGNPKRNIHKKIKEKKINLNQISISEIHRYNTNNELSDKENKNNQTSVDIKIKNNVINSSNNKYSAIKNNNKNKFQNETIKLKSKHNQLISIQNSTDLNMNDTTTLNYNESCCCNVGDSSLIKKKNKPLIKNNIFQIEKHFFEILGRKINNYNENIINELTEKNKTLMNEVEEYKKKFNIFLQIIEDYKEQNLKLKEYIKKKETNESNKKELFFRNNDINSASKNFTDNKNSLIIKIPKNLNLFQDKDNNNEASYLTYKNINKSSNNIFIDNNREKIEENPHMTINNSIFYNNNNNLYSNSSNLYVKKRTTTSIKTRNNHSVNYSKKKVSIYEYTYNKTYLMYTLYQNNYLLYFDYKKKLFYKQEIKLNDSYYSFIEKYKNSRGNIILNHKNDLYIITGLNNDMFYKFKNSTQTFNFLCYLNSGHKNGKLIIYENELFCISGEENKNVEVYINDENKWITVSKINFERSNFGSAILKYKYLFLFFGFNTTLNHNLDTIEYTDINLLSNKNNFNNVNCWKYLLFDYDQRIFNMSISGFTSIKINEEKVIFIGGYNDKDKKYINNIYQLNLRNDSGIMIDNYNNNYIEELNIILSDIWKNNGYYFTNENTIFSDEENAWYQFDNLYKIHRFCIDDMKHDIFYI